MLFAPLFDDLDDAAKGREWIAMQRDFAVGSTLTAWQIDNSAGPAPLGMRAVYRPIALVASMRIETTACQCDERPTQRSACELLRKRGSAVTAKRVQLKAG